MTLDQIVARAKSACGKNTIYRLGKGGMKPERAHPANSEGMCDCSGFAAWALGISRQCAAIGGGWIETSMIVRDATGPQKVFRRVEQPKPGHLVVYGDAGGHQGHVAVITRVIGAKADRVVHCSGSSFREHNDAIRETDARLFARNPRAIYVEFKGLPA